MRTFIQRSARAALAVFMAVVCALGTLAFPLSALADDATVQTNVHGTDSLETNASEWELIRVGDHQGEPLYIDVYKTEEGQTPTFLSYRQKYDLASEAVTNGPSLEQGTALAHILSLALDGATPQELYGSANSSVRYHIVVWASQRGGDALYQGTVYPVYGHLTSEGQAEDEGYVLLGIRTASTTERSTPKNLGVGPTIYKDADGGRDAYALQRQASVDNVFDDGLDAFVATYEKASADSVTGTVTYKTDDGEVVRTESFAGIGEDGLDVKVDQSFFSDGEYYRTLSAVGTTKHLSAGQPNFTVRVVKVEDMAQANAYQLTISYEAENPSGANQVLWTDSVDVHGGGFQYSLPTSFSSGASHSEGIAYYSFQGVEGNQVARVAHEWGNPLVLTGDLSQELFDQDVDGNRVLHAVYSSSEDTQEATFTVVEVDGTNATEIGRKSGTVTPDKDFTYEPASFELNGTTYVPAASNTGTITYKWGDLTDGKDLMVYVYYVPEGYVPGSAYEIQVRYQDIATGAVLKTESFSVNPDMTDFLTVVGDESFSADGENYVRLPGQEAGIRHAFYSPTRVYTIYYRNVNDQLNANTVIQRTQIIDSPRQVAAGAAGGAAVAAPIAAAAPAAAPAATTDAGLAPGDATTIINDDDNPLAGPDGQTTAEERIDDDANPLAAGFKDPAVMGGTIAGIAALLALLFFFLYKRKKNSNASDTKNA